MIQIILDGVALPQRSGGSYACWPDELAQQVDMISGRRVKEKRGTVWVAQDSFDYLDDETYRAALEVLRRGTSFPASVLPDNSTEMVSSLFMTESLTPATFGFVDGGKPVWRGLAFRIREVKPHA